MIKYYLLLLITVFGLAAQAQNIPLSENSEISILTIGPGNNLNDAFGHNAFRITDTAQGFDIIYDYGRYDFNTPNFYLKFAQGKLLYEIGFNNFQAFLDYYKGENRWIKEQRLNLTDSEKKKLFDYLQTNTLAENKQYQYDFFFDNCATKMRDMMVNVLGDKIAYDDSYVTEPSTFRELIQENLDTNSWGSLGIDVALGAVIDTEATAWEQQYLPKYIFEAGEKATITRDGNQERLVTASENLFVNSPAIVQKQFFLSPLFIFGLLGLLIVYITYKDAKNKTRSRGLDAILFFVTGLIGVLICLLWFATDHTATANNYNVLWAFPFNILFIVAILKRTPRKWLRRYIIFLILALLLLVIHWISGVQRFAIGLLPLLIAMAIRYVYLMRCLKPSEEEEN